ncbi:MAG TPA: ABC-type transport auxiliary lipoprotein family protein [Smithellaceae bacterium]|nr:ABC-type transport auxiliary lipoprotein family protein [Smithellaceae bacterium]HRS89436.1 ABC-type transport auxiliary lipoprotein family protein [Smithellaceae bacterium]HRV26155.1 ABC-type transport auxiliary lipoprotein family protein [Smithellaceae bacterium]
MKRKLFLEYFLRTACVIFPLFFLGGCSSLGKPAHEIKYYILDYPAPAIKQMPQIDYTIRLNRFTIAAAYNTQNMIFRPDKYTLDYFSYNRWAVNPADMVADILQRDLQAAGLFGAVFSRYSIEDAHYILQGSIGEFFLRAEPNGKRAVLDIKVTLKDSKKREAQRRVVFQKIYYHEEPLTEQTPRGYCEAMSRALEKLSGQITLDIYQAIK